MLITGTSGTITSFGTAPHYEGLIQFVDGGVALASNAAIVVDGGPWTTAAGDRALVYSDAGGVFSVIPLLASARGRGLGTKDSPTFGGASIIADADAVLALEAVQAADTTYRRKAIHSSAGAGLDGDWLFRSIRPSDGAVIDHVLSGAVGGAIWHAGNLDPDLYARITTTGATQPLAYGRAAASGATVVAAAFANPAPSAAGTRVVTDFGPNDAGVGVGSVQWGAMATDASNGVAGVVSVSNGGTRQDVMIWHPQRVLPAGDATIDLGSAAARFGNAYVAHGYFDTLSANALSLKNESTADVITKTVGQTFYGRDTVSTQKVVARIEAVSADQNWVGADLALTTRLNDVTREVARLTGAGDLLMGGANTVISALRHVRLRSYTVATLPTSGIASGDVAMASNGRAVTATGALEDAGSGTGCAVHYLNGAWRIIGTNQQVSA